MIGSTRSSSKSFAPKRSTVAVVACVVAAALTGCGGEASGVDEDCAKAAEIPPKNGAGTIALVVDNTASNSRGALPEALSGALAEAQNQQLKLAIIPVDGAGVTPSVVRTVALEPNPDVDSPAADKARKIVLGCVGKWIREPATLPKAPGSAVLEAISAAARQQPKQILVLSDGLGSAGDFDLNSVGFDTEPAALADALRRANALAPELSGQSVLWSGQGESRSALSQSLRNSLRSSWGEVFKAAGATVAFDPRTGSASGATDEKLPDDNVRIPEQQRLTFGCTTQWTVPAALLFPPETDVLQPGADQVLAGVAADLNSHADWVATITGHTADYGSADGQQALSQRRADSVMKALRDQGVGENRLTANGVGSSVQAAGTSDRTAAENRRVVIKAGPKGCSG